MVFKSFPVKNTPGRDGFGWRVYKTLKKKDNPAQTLPKKKKNEGIPFKPFYQDDIVLIAKADKYILIKQ